MLQAAELCLAQTEKYEELTLKHIAEFIGRSVDTVYRWLPVSEWERMREEWIQKRLRLAMDIVCAETKTQEDLSLERIARVAGMPLSVADHFLHRDEWQPRPGVFPADQEKREYPEQSSITLQYVHRAELYLSQTETYEEVTMKHLVEFLGEAIHIVHKRLPFCDWKQLRNTWIENHLRQALDTAYMEARTQEDFTLELITRHARMPYLTVRRFLSEVEWQARQATLPTLRFVQSSQYVIQAEAYLAQTEDYDAVSITHFAKFLDVPQQTVSDLLSNHQWKELRKQWIEKRLGQAMEAVYKEAKTREDFTVEAIARRAGIPNSTARLYLPVEQLRARQESLPSERSSLLQQLRQALERVYAESKTQDDFTMHKVIELTGVSNKIVYRLIGHEWRTLLATLPTTKEKVLSALQRLVDAHTPVNELTRQRVIELADVNGNGDWGWFVQAYQAACCKLALLSHKQVMDPPPGMNTWMIPGGWVDLNGDCWDLRPAGRHFLSRDRLRPDIADIVWPLLKEELQSPDIALGTVDFHYQIFLKVATVLGDEVPDVRRATLEAVQRAWMNFNGTMAVRMHVRPRLVQIFETLIRLVEQDDKIDRMEMLRISVWLRDDVSIGSTNLGEDFLSESELNAVIRVCLLDINAGIDYTNTAPDLLAVNLRAWSQGHANVVVHWAIALMLLIMAYTGLRRQSVLNLKMGDWAEVHSGLYVLAWGHNKKVEEHVAVLPAVLAQELELYVQRTAQVRAALETESVFLGNNQRGYWEVFSASQYEERLEKFAKRHLIEREGKSLTLNSTVLRRTYVTRALYEGRNIAALCSQLGHSHLESTLRYAKFDQYVHPAEVGIPLDKYGRKALTLWKAPLILDELDPDERAFLLDVKVKRKQDVGLCRHDQCVKAVEGSPPPCSLCEHLVTSQEFLDAWETEHRWRKQDLERLAMESGSEMMLAQMKFQFERFEANFALVLERFHP